MRIRTIRSLGVNTHNPNLSTTITTKRNRVAISIQNSSSVCCPKKQNCPQKEFLPCSSVCCPSQSHPDLAVQQHFELKMKKTFKTGYCQLLDLITKSMLLVEIFKVVNFWP